MSRESANSAYFDFIRGLAAIAVLINHLKQYILVDYPDVSDKNTIVKIFYYYLSSYGHHAVIVFFVLSGLFVSKAALKDVANDGNWSWGKFLVSRLTRLYLVLIPGLMLGFFIDRIGIHLFTSSGVYSGGYTTDSRST